MTNEIKMTRDTFEYWLAHMPFALEQFIESLPDEMRYMLDYSVESLDDLERWILETYPSGDAMLNERTVWDGIARYIGTTFRKHIGGKWDIELDNSDKVFYRIPIIANHRGRCRIDICPFALATASATRRNVGYLRGVLENYI